MYWSGPGNRRFGRKMLKKLFFISGILLSLNVLACWRLEGSFAVDGETWKINQKIDHNKEYVFPMGAFILNLNVQKEKKVKILRYKIQEKEGIKLNLVSQGEEEVKENETNTIFAKGEENRPQSIITVKLINI